MAGAVDAGDVDTVYALMCADLRDTFPRDHVADRMAPVTSDDGPLLDQVRTGRPRQGEGVAEVDVRYDSGGEPGESTLPLVDEGGWRLCDGSWVDF